ncbi:MAG: HD domain-containing protein [Kiritimatiellae bacterium]|jgi:exopolyphosphatase/guanosine-5'-triphosphate,3'-diphosphate pyrophosphatase|nr:HD domain-containing protein [Kiritimatiellia bacterium]
MSTRTVAVIDIGTSSIRMALADIDDAGNIQFLEKLNQSVRLGQDVFTRGRIRRTTVEACVRILESFQQVMKEYKVSAEDVRAVASSAVQEATNRDTLLDRVAMATGIEIEIIDDAEATRLTYLSVLPFLRDKRRKTTEHTLVLEVGGGRTEMLELRNQNIIDTRVMRLGSVRLRNLLEQQRTPQDQIRDVLNQEITNTLHQLKGDFKEGNPSLIALGGDARFLAMQINPEWNRDLLQPIPLKRWKAFTDHLLELSLEQCVEQYHLTFAEAETLGPALYAYSRFAEDLGCKTLKVSAFTMRDGLLQELAQQDGWTESYRRQMLESALQLGQKFHLDEKHGEEVAGLALQLFDELQEEHHLGPRYRVLLHIACLLHEIGTFISSTSHHKHSMYILANTPIFGLGRRDSRIVANVARYHRRSTPKPTHPFYQSLSRRDRISVQQLSAILRVADALARSRGRRIQHILCERSDETLFIRVPGVDNLHLENSALQVKGQMFEQVFGMNVILVKG